jgi:glycosyltransferase involved in cell wall biosynthesis
VNKKWSASLQMLISVIIPAHNEPEGINTFHSKLLGEGRVAKDSYEIIYVNDDSQDTIIMRHRISCSCLTLMIK